MPTSTAIGRQHGITLVEGAIALAVVSVLAGSALPNLNSLRIRAEQQSAAAQFETDVQLARSASVARNEGMRLSFHVSGTMSCYVIHTGGADACRCGEGDVTVCEAGAEPVRSAYFHNGPVTLRSNSGSLLFDPLAGTVTPTATVKFATADGASLNQVINVMGRVRTCWEGASFSGVRPC